MVLIQMHLTTFSWNKEGNFKWDMKAVYTKVHAHPKFYRIQGVVLSGPSNWLSSKATSEVTRTLPVMVH